MKIAMLLCLGSLDAAFSAELVNAQEATPVRKAGDAWFEPFKITVEGKAVEGELGRLMVRENRTKADSRLIELAFLRLKSTAAKPGRPVIYLDGGPGSSPINL